MSNKNLFKSLWLLMLFLVVGTVSAQITTQEALNAAISAAEAGSTVEISAAGTYKVPGISKNITVKGAVDGVVFDCVGSGSIASIPNGCTFENVKFNMGSSYYHGFQHAGTINMQNCTFEGLFFSYGDMNFTGCTFNQTDSEYCMWDYGKDLTYTNCTFNCYGKFINVYNEGNGDWKLKVEGCTFNSTKKNKAALNIKASCGAKVLGWDVTINNCTVNDVNMFPSASGDATSTLYVGSPVWQVDDRTAAALESNIVKVAVDGVFVYGADLTISNKDELIAFEQAVNTGKTYAGKLVVLENDIDLDGVEWKPIGNVTSYPGITFSGTFDGKNHIISNMTTSDNLPNHATAGFFGSSNGTIKNLTLKDIKVTSSHWAAGICGYTSDKALKIENCKVIGGTITSVPELIGSEYDNGDKVGGILGYGVSAATISGCAVDGLTITAYRDLGGIAGYMPGLVSDCSVKNTTIVQSNKNGYKTGVTTYKEIVGRDANANNTGNTSENVELKSVSGEDPVTVDVPTVSEEVVVIEKAEDAPDATPEEKAAATTAVTTVLEEISNNTTITTEKATNVAQVEEVTTLKIEVKNVAVETKTENAQTTANVTKVTYDVQPMNGETEVNVTEQPITFRLPVPQSFKGTSVKVSHKHGEVTTSTIEAVQGEGANKYVALSSDKFSEWTLEDVIVAKIGNTTYGTLAAAVAGAANDDTITLLADAQANAMVEISGKNITLDLNGKTISPVTGTKINGGLIGIHNGAGLTIDDSSEDKNGTITSGTDGKVYAAVQVTVKGDEATEPATLVVNNGNLEGFYYAISGNGSRHNTSVIVNGGSLKGLANSPSTDDMGLAIYHPQNGTLTITGGTLEGPAAAVELRAGTINVTGGTLKATATEFTCKPNGSGTTTVGAALAIAQHTTKKDIKVTISGGTFEGVRALNESNPQANDPAPQVNLAVTDGTFKGAVETTDVNSFISGGTFSKKIPEAYCAAAFVPTANEDGTYGVKEGTPVALVSVSKVKYASLQNAVASVQSNKSTTIQMLEDVDLQSTLTIPADKIITLDLNGKKVSYDKTTISNLGTLTVKDNTTDKTGAIISTTHCGIASGDNSKTTFVSGNIESVEGAIITGKSTGAKIYVQGGVLKASDNAVIAGNGSDREGDKNTISITGGKLEGSITSTGYVACGIYAPWKDMVTVSGGEIIANGGCGILARAGSVTVSGNATITTTGNNKGKVGDSRVVVPCSAIVYDSEANYPGLTAATQSRLDVKGGTFKSEDGVAAVDYVASENDAQRIMVSGGSFSSILSSNVCHPSFIPVTTKDENGLYSVVRGTYVAQIGNEKYGDLAYAISTVPTDGTETTIKVLNNIVAPEAMTINGGKNIVLDLNGKTVQHDGAKLFIVANATLHVTGTGYLFENAVDQYAPIIAKGAATDVANYTNIIIDKNVTLKGDYCGIFVAKDEAGTYNNYGLNITMNGKINLAAVEGSATNYGVGVYVNGNNTVATGNVMNINLTGATISGGKTGVYAAGYANWTLDNTTITGYNSAVEVRSGKMEINSGSYTATNENFSSTANGNGATVEGAAIAIAQHTTKKDIAVTINGGTFTGSKALYEANPQANDPAPQVALAVTGGTFKGAVETTDVKNFISGGSFSEIVPEKYCAEGYKPVETPNKYGYYAVEVLDDDNSDFVITKNSSKHYYILNNESDIVLEDSNLGTGVSAIEVKKDVQLNSLSYHRNFSETSRYTWQAWIAPFDTPVTAGDDTPLFAKIVQFAYVDAEGRVVEDTNSGEFVLVVSKLGSGETVKANYPYFIKPRTVGLHNFSSTNSILYKTEPNAITTSTTTQQFTFNGIYESEVLNDKYIITADGKFNYWNGSNTNSLNPFRWYFEIEDKDAYGNTTTVQHVSSIRIAVLGEDELATAIVNAKAEELDSETIYDLFGRMTQNAQRGINIQNGKKFLKK